MYIESNCAYCGNLVTRKKQSESANVKLHFCDLNCKSLYQKLAKPVTKEWLEEHYINKRLDTSQIGIIVKRDPKTVWNWLKDFGIPTRSRGGFNCPHPFKKGESLWTGKKHPPEFSEKLRQIRIKDSHYPKKPDGTPYWKGKKGEETNNWKGGITPERQIEYDKKEWKAVVVKVWHRDNAICQRCGLDHRIINREEVQFAIHHIVSFQDKRLRYALDNLVLLCRPCHLFIHSNANVNKEYLGESNDSESNKPAIG
jgi:thymidylate synthase (FAD)